MSEKIRFALVGLFNTSFDFVLFNFFVLVVGLPTLVGNIMSVSICIVVSYFLNHHFVFRHEAKFEFHKFAMFILVTGFSSIVMQSFIIWLFESFTQSSFGKSLFVVGDLTQNHALEINIAKAAAVLVGMVWNFLLYKYVVFRKSSEKITAEEIIQ